MEEKLNTTYIPTTYTHFSSTPTMSEQTSTDHTTLHSLSTEHSTSLLLSTTPLTTDHDIKYTQQTSEDPLTFSSSLSTEGSTEFNTIRRSDQTFSNFDTTESTQLPSTTLVETLSTSLTTTSEYLVESNVPYFSSPFEHLSTTESSDDHYSQSQMITDSSTNSIQTSTLIITTTDFIDKETENGVIQEHFPSMLVEVDISSTLDPSLPFEVSSTVFTPSLSSQSPSSSSSDPSLAYSSMTSTKLNQLLSSKHFSVAPTFPTSTSTIQATDLITTSDTTEQSSMTNFSDESSSPITTSYPDETSSSSYVTSSEPSTTDFTTLLTTSFEPSTTDFTTLLTTSFEPSTTDFTTLLTTSFEPSTTDYATSSTMIVTSTILYSTTTTQTDESSTLLILTTDNKETLAITDSPSFETTPLSSTESSLEIESTTFPDAYDLTTAQPILVVTHSKPRSKRPTRRTSRTTTTTTSTTTSTTRTINRYRTRKQTTTHLKSESSTTTNTTTTTTSTTVAQTTSSPIIIWYSKSNSLQPQQMIIIKPTLNSNSTNTLLSNELLNKLFNNTNNSTEKLIFFNLADLPPSSWNLSLNTNESVFLDIILPSLSPPFNPNSTTNLTFSNVDANRFSTNIVGAPVNLQVDNIQTKQFSLAMNLTNNQSNQSSSDVVIGHIRSEQFELNITKSDNINVHVQQVDSETAELFFDSKFCTNESNLQINLNLSKNGSIRYGDREPLRIGPVFTRVHMLKQSCDLEQPFTLFFDICQGQNPCLNGGTCQSEMPNYDDPSYSQQENSQINYNCICPARVSGGNCEELQYPLGYCINGGNLISIFDNFNQSIEQCSCTQGYQGEHCEDNIDDCINIDCSNHGICKDGINTYSCSCFDGFYGDKCEQKNVETVLLQVASKSFATVAILLIAGIAGLVVASDIHTYLTRQKHRPAHRVNKIPRATSELFENSVLLLGFGDAPIELSDLSTIGEGRKASAPTTTMKQRPKDMRKQSGYKRITERRYTYATTLEQPSSKLSLLSNPANESIL